MAIRETNQNAGRLVRQVARTGESIVVTDRGTPVARLVPIEEEPLSPYERLLAEGKITRATTSAIDAARYTWDAPSDPLTVLREFGAIGERTALR